MCNNTMSSLEEAVFLMKKSKFWSKAAQKDTGVSMSELQEELGALKKVLCKKSVSLEEVREVVVKAATKVKEIQLQVRELKQLANKTNSTAASKNSKKS